MGIIFTFYNITRVICKRVCDICSLYADRIVPVKANGTDGVISLLCLTK